MNPTLIYRILAGAGGLLGLAGASYGADQHVKRKQEQAANRTRLQQLDEGLVSKEDELASLTSKLGEKSDQVRILAAEIEMLRDRAAQLRGNA